MTDKTAAMRADVASMMLKTLEDGGASAAAIIATLEPEEARQYLITALALGAEAVFTETTILREHGVQSAGPVLAYLAATVTAPLRPE